MSMRFWRAAEPDIPLYSAATFRTLGTAASPQNIASIENPAASGHLLIVRYVSVAMDTTAVLVTVAPSLNLSRPTALPTGGTAITHTKHEASVNSVAVVRSGTASDGGGATAITATAGPTARTSLSMRLHTAVGMVLSDTIKLVGPMLYKDDYFELAAGEALLIQGVIASAATTHFVANFSWRDLLL